MLQEIQTLWTAKPLGRLFSAKPTTKRKAISTAVLAYSFLAWILKKSRVLTLIRSQYLGSLSSWLVQPKLTRKTLLKLLHPDWTWPCCRALEPFANPLPIKRKSLQLCFATNLNFKAEKLTGIAAVMALSPRTFALSSPCEPLLAGPCVLSRRSKICLLVENNCNKNIFPC